MKKFLIVSPFFFPEQISTGKLNTDLAEELIKNGYQVTFICSHPLYPSWKVKKTTQNLPNIKTIRGGSWVKYPSSNILRRLTLELWFTFFSFYHFLKEKKQADFVVMVFPPTLFAFLIMQTSKKSKHFVGLIHDLQTVYASNKKTFFYKKLFSLIKFFEKKTFNKFDHLIFWSETMRKKGIEEFGLDTVKTSYHYPCVNISTNTRKNLQTSHLSNIFSSGYRSIVYSGALGEKQAPEKLLHLLDISTNYFEKVNAYIFSEGFNFEEIKRKNTNPKIHFHPLVDKKDLEELLSCSDIQIIPQLEGTSIGSLPSKLPNLIAASCKILCITDKGSELESLLKNYSKAAISTSWSDESLLDSISKLLANDLSSATNFNSEKLLKLFSIHDLVKKISDKSFKNINN